MNEPPNGYFPRFFRVPCLENPGENRASSNLWPQSCSLAGGELIRHSSFINHSSIIHQSFIERAHDVVVFVQEYDSCKSIQIQHHPRDSDHFQSFSYLW